MMASLRSPSVRNLNVLCGCIHRRFSYQSSISSLTEDTGDRISYISGHDRYGYTVNGVHMRGSLLVFRNFSLLWNVPTVAAISPRNLAPVHMVSPSVELLLVGTGSTMAGINPSLYAYMSRKGIALEALTNTHAISAFNTLILEGRHVAIALISRVPVPRTEACLYTHEASQRQESESDARLRLALSRDYNAADAARLLTSSVPVPSQAGGSASTASTAATGNAPPPPRPLEYGRTYTTQELSELDPKLAGPDPAAHAQVQSLEEQSLLENRRLRRSAAQKNSNAKRGDDE